MLPDEWDCIHFVGDRYGFSMVLPEESLDVKEEITTAARQYMVSLYDRSDFVGTLDALRAHLFVNIKGDMRCLPPTEDAFLLHLHRALHQLAVCKRAHLV